MLMDIKNLLKERGEMTLTDLGRHFYVSESVMTAMLAQWQKKGRILTRSTSGSCGSTCGGCTESSDDQTYYRWKSVAEKPIFAQVK